MLNDVESLETPYKFDIKSMNMKVDEEHDETKSSGNNNNNFLLSSPPILPSSSSSSSSYTPSPLLDKLKDNINGFSTDRRRVKGFWKIDKISLLDYEMVDWWDDRWD